MYVHTHLEVTFTEGQHGESSCQTSLHSMGATRKTCGQTSLLALLLY